MSNQTNPYEWSGPVEIRIEDETGRDITDEIGRKRLIEIVADELGVTPEVAAGVIDGRIPPRECQVIVVAE